jgi:hypothetical protein
MEARKFKVATHMAEADIQPGAYADVLSGMVSDLTCIAVVIFGS